MVRRVCLVSGGTGGHLLPALVLARAMRACGHEPLLVTEGREVEREILRRELPDVAEFELPMAPRSRLTMPWWLAHSTAVARRLLRDQQVDCVVSTGGRPSLPVGLAARLLGRPLYLLEQNAVMGRANRWLLRLARRIYHGLPAAGSASARAMFTGTPLRHGLGRIDRGAAREALGLVAGTPVVLVTGGSQGAQSLNDTVPRALVQLGRDLQVLHLSGLGRDDAVRLLYSERRVSAHVRPVALDMDRMFAAADLVICRGGGTTVAELAAAGRPAVIVPYPHHRDRQQWHNARVLADRSAAIIIEEPALTVDSLVHCLGGLLDDPARLLAMGTAAQRLHNGDAVTMILRDMNLLDDAGLPADGNLPLHAEHDAAAGAGAAARRPRLRPGRVG